MFWEYAESIIQLLANMIAMMLCLYRFIGRSRKAWLYAILFFLGGFLSCYFWASYLIIMGDWPNVSTSMTYFGWNLSYVFLLLLMLQMKKREEKRFFHPLMLIPVPLNIWQLNLYNSLVEDFNTGSILNNCYQTLMCTLFACLSIQGLCWWWKHRNETGIRKPLVSLSCLLYSVSEFGMWTSSCYDEPIGNLYYVFSFLFSASFFFLVFAIRYANGDEKGGPAPQLDSRYQRIMRQISLLVVLACSVGGVLLGMQMRNMISAQIGEAATSDVFVIISLVLFVISLVIAAFTVVVMMVAYFAHRAVENSHLREAKRIAEQANQAKSEFLANMSHEIRTPINAVMGMNELIMRDSRQARTELPEGQEKLAAVFDDITGYSGNIESAGKTLLSIINDILDISRIEAGKMEIREDSYQLGTMLNDACNMVLLKADEKGIEFRTEVDDTLPDKLFGDETHIRQIITNLLNNAVKYTRKGNVTLRVTGEPKTAYEAGDIFSLVIEVRDTGIGIRKDDFGKLFGKFERIDLKENSNIEGSGLGLAICKNLLDMMGGEIKVESEFGRGSVFTAVIPQKVIQAEPIGHFDSRESRKLPENSRKLFRAPAARILVVDDTRMNILVVQGLLKTSRIQSDTAASGEEAVELCSRVPYDLILMDQRMPGMDGAETMRLIRKKEGSLNRQAPIICLTADAVSGARQRYLAEGYDDYLTKPVKAESLEEMMIRYLPSEKVELYGQEGADPGNIQTGMPEAAELRAAGITPETGLNYCQGDEKLYRRVLGQFACDMGETEKELTKYLKQQDWHNYGVRVHALKSSSRLIGADALSEQAAGLEKAAGEKNKAAVENGHGELIIHACALAEAIRRILSGEDSNQPDTDDGEVMEFLPE